MTARARVAYALCACLLGCAAPGSRLTPVSPTGARDAIVIGKSTRADVAAALGQTAAVAFDSGYEVWVYKVAGDASGKAEFVVLFAPSGVVSKTRIRPAP